MPDILIRGMEMPHNCFLCPLSFLKGERLFCHITTEEVIRAKIAPECPIQELPPHGDLIDLSELQKFPIRLDHYDKEHGDEHFVYGIESLMEYAECLPVIVPAERRDADA